MAKSKKPKTIAVKDPQQTAMVRRVCFHVAGVIVFVGLIATGLHFIRQKVERSIAFPPYPPKVVLKNRPVWMSDARAIQIINSIRPAMPHSAFDRQLLSSTAAILQANPWVKEVKQIRRVFGQQPGDTIEVDCEYRAPIALVHWKNYYWLVDGEGIKLPEQFTADELPSVVMSADRRVNIRLIEGVNAPPVESGQKWPGDDLVAGLDLVKILYGLDYADEILQVDVSNFAGRVNPREAQLDLVTKYSSKIHWGRPVNAKDFFVEIPTARKLRFLEEVYQEFHRIDGGRAWIDIRHDKITYPADSSAHADGSR